MEKKVQGLNNTLADSEEWISELKDKVVEIIHS